LFGIGRYKCAYFMGLYVAKFLIVIFTMG